MYFMTLSPDSDIIINLAVTVNNGNNLADSHERTVRNGDNHSQSESDAVINRTLDSMSDHAFCELFQLPPAKVTVSIQW